MKTMGLRIRQKRRELDLTLEELGSRLGVQKSAVSKWEKGEVINIKREYIDKMASIFDVSPQWLMGYEKASEVTLTYEAPGHEPVRATVEGHPIIGAEATSKRAVLYQAALSVRPENLDVAIKLLKSLS